MDESECSILNNFKEWNQEISFNFGTVLYGSECRKSINLEKYLPKEEDEYIIEPVQDHFCKSFKFDFYKNIRKNEVKKLSTITFNPVFANQKCFEIFCLKSTNFTLKITLKGSSIGPLVTPSVKYIDFLLPNDRTREIKFFELKNESKCSTFFNVDTDFQNNDIFTVEPLQGEVIIRKRFYIKVTFRPPKSGIFTKQLFLLLHNQDPIIINLMGYNFEKRMKNEAEYLSFLDYQIPFSSTVSYKGYFNETLTPATLVPYWRIIKSDSSLEDYEVILKNNLDSDIEVEWILDAKSSPFYVVPKQFRLKSKQQAYLSCHYNFNKNEQCLCDFKHISGLVYWSKDKEENNIGDSIGNKQKTIFKPVPLTLRLAANVGCDSHLLIDLDISPHIVILPPTLPGHESFTTFLLTTNADRKLFFKFVPKAKTNITIKPMIGMIKDYQTIAVKLKTEQESFYSEMWCLQINSNRMFRIQFKGEATTPQVQLSHDNRISFGYIQQGNLAEVTRKLTNVSTIRLEFEIQGKEFLTVEPSIGRLVPNETVNIRFTLKPAVMPCIWQVPVIIKAIEGLGEVFGACFYQSFLAQCQINSATLCSIPNKYDLGDVLFESEISKSFDLHNFGLGEIHFKIFAESESHHDKIRLHPITGTLSPKESLQIDFNLKAKTFGKNRILIKYLSRVSSKSKEVSAIDPVQVFEIMYNSFYPIMQIMQIVDHNFGPLFSKVHLWTFLCINLINKQLESIEANQSIVIHAKLPDYPLYSPTKYIKLLIKNTSNVENVVELKRKKLCHCSLEEKKISVNSVHNAYNCPHRKILAMELSNSKIMANSYEYLTITVNYNIPDESKLSYSINLSNNRHIEWRIKLSSIPTDVSKVSSYTFNYSMILRDVFIGEYSPEMQTFWLYNPSSKVQFFDIKCDEIENLNKSEEFEVLQIVPNKGRIFPQERIPLCIYFHPIQGKIYSVEVPIQFSYGEVLFTIMGEGNKNWPDYKSNWCNVNFPICSHSISDEYPITLSADYMHISAIPLWNYSDRYVFISNNTKDKVFYYEWTQAGIQDVVVIEYIESPFGFLKPKETHRVKIRITTFSVTCRTGILLNCKIYDYLQKTLHEISLKAWQNKQQLIDQEFEISSSNTTKISKNTIEIVPKPQIQFLTLMLYIRILDPRRLRSDDLLKFLPTREFSISKSSFLDDFFPKTTREPIPNPRLPVLNQRQLEFIKSVIESIISNFLFSKLFKKCLTLWILEGRENYCQLIVAEKKGQSNEHNVDQYFKMPNYDDLSSVFEDLLTNFSGKALQIQSSEATEKEIEEFIKNYLKKKPETYCVCLNDRDCYEIDDK